MDGSFVFKSGGKIYKVPSNETEALKSSKLHIYVALFVIIVDTIEAVQVSLLKEDSCLTNHV